MRLGLLGYPINHSLSPSIYKRLVPELASYELFSCKSADEVPSLEQLSSKLDGLSITSPYKKHFIGQIEFSSPLVKQLGIVNTLAFVNKTVIGTNTDLLAVVEILKNYQLNFPKLQIILLGSGSMAEVTKIVARDLKIDFKQFSRKTHPQISQLDIASLQQTGIQNLVINACSREFVFNGQVSGQEIFWDYNYSFLPHQNTLPLIVKTYQDGQHMLELQAIEAIKFWKQVNPKLK